MTSWVQFTNEKLYLARLQLDAAVLPRLGDPALRESARQSGILLLHAAWVGLLNEIAESYNVRERTITSLSDLVDVLPGATSEVEPLLALYEDPRSWLRILLGEYEACLQARPQKVQGGALLIETCNVTEAGCIQQVLEDLKNYIAAFRERIQEC